MDGGSGPCRRPGMVRTGAGWNPSDHPYPQQLRSVHARLQSQYKRSAPGPAPLSHLTGVLAGGLRNRRCAGAKLFHSHTCAGRLGADPAHGLVEPQPDGESSDQRSTGHAILGPAASGVTRNQPAVVGRIGTALLSPRRNALGFCCLVSSTGELGDGSACLRRGTGCTREGRHCREAPRIHGGRRILEVFSRWP